MKKAIFAAALALSVTGAANAGLVYAGSWHVDAGPSWSVVPAAYTGQEAAALLFGGLASDYSISTIDNDVGNVDFMAWVSTYGGACGGGFPCGTKVAENFKISTAGLYQNPGDTSAFVQDWARGAQFKNFAFRNVVPEPGTLALAGLSLFGLAAFRGRKAS